MNQCQGVGLHFNVAQGSSLGTKNYSMYTKPVGEIIKRHNVMYHCYGDDTQEYMILKQFDKCYMSLEHVLNVKHFQQLNLNKALYKILLLLLL